GATALPWLTLLKRFVIAAQQVAIGFLDGVGDALCLAKTQTDQPCIPYAAFVHWFGNIPQADQFFDAAELFRRRVADHDRSGIDISDEPQLGRPPQSGGRLGLFLVLKAV